MKLSHEELMEHRAEKLDGKSPRERGRQKMLDALYWVYRWGWSSPGLVNQAAGSKDRGVASKLIKQGFLKSTKPSGGNAFKRVPSQILTLTPDGVALVEKHFEDLLSTGYSDKYTLLNVQHDYVVQQLCGNAEWVKHSNNAGFFITPLEMTAQSMEGIKQPDALLLGGAIEIAIEVELDGKWGMRLDQFVRKCLHFVGEMQTDNDCEYFRSVLIFVETEASLNRYRQAFKPGRNYDLWFKDSVSKKWATRANKGTVPDWVAERISVELLPKFILG